MGIIQATLSIWQRTCIRLLNLGGPDITEAIETSEGIYQIVYYRTLRAISDGITTKDECTALLFHNQKLIAVASPAEQQYRQLEQRPAS